MHVEWVETWDAHRPTLIKQETVPVLALLCHPFPFAVVKFIYFKCGFDSDLYLMLCLFVIALGQSPFSSGLHKQREFAEWMPLGGDIDRDCHSSPLPCVLAFSFFFLFFSANAP